MIKLHQHHLGQFIRDRKDFYDQYVLKLPQSNPDYFKIGRAVDVGVKYFHLSGAPVYDIELMDKDKTKLVKIMIDGYCRKYKDTYFHDFSIPYYKIPITLTFNGYNSQLRPDVFNMIPKVENFLLTCSPDLVAYDYNNNAWIIEIKTGGVYAAKDFQTLTYCWAFWKIKNEIPEGIIKRTIKKPIIKQRKKETPEEFSARLKNDYRDRPDNYYKVEAVEVSLSEILDHERYIIEILASIYRAINNGRYSFY